MMNIKRRKEEGVTILELDGKLTIGTGDVKLRDEVRDALQDGAKKLLLNLKRVRTMDSSGLGELIRCKATAANLDATIKLVHVEDKVEEVLEMTRLIGVFDNYDNEIDAVASFRDK
ncbi:MAG: STAS domain-containing protein [bacterium]|nr:STAS domain-containing protein [bacterium]